ncbi:MULTISPECIES: tetratricopeptide repeat protein [Reichenbachiella]|uniref:Tetratricopeptide repeat-containing protein n=1 Tax=Reichenbachiella agariperforans TaxID=156994 RepID=A0A1M6NSZ9_REIAG|nr:MULTISPECIES: tetratricopeptide repeat protein [Reichenbachiella]MBU2916026.1 tetratricopeptide repeat protein [Reichenbachiella agariperforans]RJE71734.1 hypothetical protein BGP76_06500 [Reichenbachiella sp. MSK19-1]SHJ98857.1 Tetratricopeptide repeat-containing protein [Reichenbachiella agariperforans]
MKLQLKSLSILLFILFLVSFSVRSQDCFDTNDCILKAIQHGSTLEAIAFYDKAEALMTAETNVHSHYDILSGRGNIYHELKDYTKALQNYNKLIQLRPDDKQALSVGYSNRGNVMSSNGNTQGAIASYTKAIEVFPPNVANLYRRASAYLKIDERDKALADLKLMAELGASSAIYYLQSEFDIDYREQQKAALAKDVQWQGIQAKTAEAEQYIKEEKYQEANDLYIEIGDLYRDRNDNENKATAWVNVAHVKNLKKDHRGAMTFASMAIGTGYPTGWMYTELALANYYEYGMSSALGVCQEGLGKFPKSSQLIGFYTYLCRTAGGEAYSAKKYEEAYGFYYEAFAFDDQDIVSIKYAGHSAYSAGYYTNALECYDKALAINPSLSTELKPFVDYCRSRSN